MAKAGDSSKEALSVIETTEAARAANDMADTSTCGNNFAKTACTLLQEYTNRLRATQAELCELTEVAARDQSRPLLEYIRLRVQWEHQRFREQRAAYLKLIRQSSQWLQHGDDPEPHFRLELDVRLTDFEQTVKTMDEFFMSQNRAVASLGR